MLKKLTAILLLLMLFFNWYGYRIITDIWVEDADKQLELQLDNNDYDESQLIEIRVALNVPYQTSQTEFERYYGEMEVDGKYYTYVKRRIDNGYLVLKCIPNDSKQKLKAAGNDYFKMANGLDQNSPDKKQGANSSYAKSFWSEYDDQLNRFDLNSASADITTNFLSQNASLYSCLLAKPWHPPQNILS